MKRHARALLLASFAVPAPGTVLAQGDGLSISGQWIRALGGDLPAAGYFTLRNDTAHVVRLTGAASSACASLTLHQTVREHTMNAMSALAPENAGHGMPTMSMMQPVDAVAIPARGSIRFEPGGYHLMCEHPDASVRPGLSIAVTLHFDGKQALTGAFPVRGPRG